MNMSKHFLCALFSFGIVASLFADEVQKANNTDDLYLGSSWVGGNAPGSGDVALWDSTVSAANTVDLGADMTWDGIRIINPGGTVTISGTNTLTLDGIESVDINLTSAAQNLVLENPLALQNYQGVEIASGRTLVLDGAVNHSGTRFTMNNGHGTLVIRDAFNVPGGGDPEQFGIYQGTVVLDGEGSALNLNGRFFFGRTSTASDATLIVSNGSHIALSSNDDAGANFIGVSAGRGDLFMENGVLSCSYLRLGCNNGQGLNTTNNLIVNGGELHVTGTTGASTETVAFTMGANHVNNSSGAATQSARVEVNGGLFNIPNGTFQIGSLNNASTGWQGVFLNGGTLAAKRFQVGSTTGSPKKIVFNGGLLRIVNSAADGEIINGSANLTVAVQSGGALIDSGERSMTLSQDLSGDPSSPGGGLVKFGSGTLTLSGDSTYAGETLVSNGTLKIEGSLAVADVVVAPGAVFSMADGAITEFQSDKMVLGGALSPASIELEVAADGSANDCVSLPAGSRLYKVGVRLYQVGTADAFYINGSYPIFRFTGAPPAIGGLFWETPIAGYKCVFTIDSQNSTINAVLQYDDAGDTFFWTATGGGNWENAANWSVAPVSGSDASILFGGSILSDAAVSLASAFTLSDLSFSSPNPYTLQGGGSLVFNNGASEASASVADGSHSIDLPVTAASPLTISVAPGSSLTLGAAVGGSGALTLAGGGTLTLETANTFSGGITASAGSVVIKADDALGTGTAVFNGAQLQIADAASVALDNDLEFLAQYSTVNVAVPAELSGSLLFGTGVDNLNKDGAGTLSYKGSSSSSVSDLQIRVRNGAMVMEPGSSLIINNNRRDTLDMSYATDNPRSFVVQSGAVVEVGGIYTGSGPSNTVHVNGGTLALSGHSSEVALLQAVSDENGTDRLIIDSGTFTAADNKYFSLGVRGGTAEIIVNGGFAHFGMLAFGVRADAAFTSSPLANGRIAVNGGLMEIVGFFNWMGDQNSSRVNEFHLNGGELRLPATMITGTAAAQSSFILDGGRLTLTGLPQSGLGSPALNNYLKGVTDLLVGNGGADIDTAGLDVSITQELKPDGASTGGLTKRGAGTLAFTNICAHTGPTVVEEGTLAVGGLTATASLTMHDGTILSLANGVFDTISVNSLSLGEECRIEMELSTVDSGCDRIMIPAGATIGSIEITLFDKGTRSSASSSGTFPLFGYSGTPPDVSGWGLSDENYGITCTFVVNSLDSTIDAVISYTDSQVAWANSGSGDWSTAANWWPLPPASSNSSVFFMDAIISNSVINIDAPVSVRDLLFDNSFSYTLSGAGVTVENPYGEAFIDVVAGAHVIASALTLPGSSTVEFDPGAGLTLSGNVSGGGSLSVQGGGTLELAGTNYLDASVSEGAVFDVTSPGGYAASALSIDGGTLQVLASDTFGCGIDIGSGGASIASVDGETLTIDQDLTGPGDLAKIGGGTLDLSAGILKYTGTTASDGGLLRLSSLPAGDLRLGGGTLDMQSVSGSSTNDLIIDSGSRGAVFDVDGAITISGRVSNASGCLLKFGGGTLTFNGLLNDFGANSAANLDTPATPAANGDGPTTGFAGLSVANGKVVLGAPGQTNSIGKLYVGIETTDQAGEETAGEVEIIDGYTLCSDVGVIGRRNGSTLTAPSGLTSRLKVSGGDIWLQGLYLGTTPGSGAFTGTPELQVSGGSCTVNREFYVNLAANGVSTVLVDGGTLIHNAADSISLRLGQVQGTGILRVSDGLAEMQGIVLAMGENGSTGIVEVTGGVLQFNGLSKRNASAGYGSLSVDGGTLRPAGGTIEKLDLFEVGSAPLTLDTSLINEFTLLQALTGAGGTDGGLVVTGDNTLRISADQQYNGPTLVSNGTLRTVAALPTGTDLTVLPGAELDADPRSTRVLTVGSLTLGAPGSSESAGVVLGIDGNGGSNDQINVTGSLTLHKAAFTLYINSSTENMYPDGTYPLITYGGSDPSDLSGLTCANPRYGKQYAFSASGGVLRVTVGTAASGAHVWSATGGGAWDTGANWLMAPGAGAAGTEVRFDSSITADASVSLGQIVTLGAVHFNDNNKYTLAGGSYGIILDSAEGNALLAVESGAHQIDSAIDLNDSLDVKVISGTQLEISGDVSGNGSLVKHNSGMLTLSGQNSYTGSTTITTGTLRLDQSATLGGGDVILSQDESRLAVVASSSSTLNNNVRMDSSIGRFEIAGDLAVNGDVSWNPAGRLFKSGTGSLTLSGSSSGTATDSGRYIDVSDGTLIFADGSDFHLNYADRDAFNMVVNNSNRRKIVFEEGSSVTAGGIYVKFGFENRFELHGRLDLVDEKDALSLRVGENDTQDRMDWFTVFDSGYLTTADESFVNVGVRGPATFIVDGGTADLDSLTLGYELGFELKSSASHGVVRNGGLLNIRNRLNWMGDVYSRHVSSLTVGSGGTLVTPATKEYQSTGYTGLSLDGGTLNISGAGSLGASLTNCLAGLDVLHIGVSGGTFEVGEDITVMQPVRSEGSTNAVLTKIGSGTLTLSQPLAWAGTVRVDEGVMSAELIADTAVADPSSNLFCRVNFEAGPASDTSGNARQGVYGGTAINTISPGARSDTAMNCNGNSSLRIPYDQALNSVNQYTIAGWVWLDSYPGDYMLQTFFSTRDPDNDNYQVMLRVVNGQLRYMTTGAIGSSGWGTYSTLSTAGSVPLGQWTHFAVVVNVNTVTIYINGQYNASKSFAGADLRLSPDRTGTSTYGMVFGGFKIYDTNAKFAGRLDDMRVHLRTLNSGEIAEMVYSSVRLPDLHVSAGSAFSAQGDSAVVNLSGEGFVVGELSVTGSVAPGDSEQSEAGAAISVETLNLASNAVFDCTWSASYSDVIVADELNIAGPGLVDLGRSQVDPIPNGYFRTVLMYYDTISGAANLDQWMPVNTGVGAGLEYDIFADDGEVVLTMKNLRGTLIILR